MQPNAAAFATPFRIPLPLFLFAWPFILFTFVVLFNTLAMVFLPGRSSAGSGSEACSREAGKSETWTR